MLDHLLPYATYLNIFLLLLASYILYLNVSDYFKKRRIARLGHNPPERPHYAPWGIDIIWDGIQHLRQNKNLELWRKIYYTWGNKNNPYTVQTTVAGLRLIFTSDPENIKVMHVFCSLVFY